MTKITAIDNKTGEVLSYDVESFRTSSQDEEWKRIKEQQLKEKHSIRTNGDKFVNGNMVMIRHLSTVLDETTLGYILYLQTSLRYDGTLGTSKRAFTKVKDFESVLNVKTLQTKKVTKTLREADVLYVNDEGVYCMNSRYHWKGKMRSSVAKKNVKLITDSIKALRDSGVKAKDAGALYLLLPYIRFESNLLAHNPYEYDVEKVQPMNLQDIAEVIKYDAKKVSSKLLKITFTAPDGRPMRAFVVSDTGKSKHVKINPLLVRRVAEDGVDVLVNEATMIDFLINRP